MTPARGGDSTMIVIIVAVVLAVVAVYVLVGWGEMQSCLLLCMMGLLVVTASFASWLPLKPFNDA
jgi:hypothetical protein